ncbi:MAG: hypothetical protein IJU26_01705 [Synergistaceae bacterium]|nr:hypothetical protein [Synergistaceae bacterium]
MTDLQEKSNLLKHRVFQVLEGFTGELDIGVQFASLGASAKVVTSSSCDSFKFSGLDVLIFDAESDSDMEKIVESLGSEGLRLSAGCAGFAKVLGFCWKGRGVHVMPERFVMLCGRVNPVKRTA